MPKISKEFLLLNFLEVFVHLWLVANKFANEVIGDPEIMLKDVPVPASRS